MAAENVNLEVGITADTKNADRDVKATATAVGALADAFREVATIANSAARALNKVEKGVTGVSASGKGTVATTKATGDAMSTAAKEAKQYAEYLEKVAKVKITDTGRFKSMETGKIVNKKTVAAGYEQFKVDSAGQQAEQKARILANIAEAKSAREAGEAYRSYGKDLLAAQQQANKRYATVGKASNNVVTSDMRGLVEAANGAARVGSSFGQIKEAAHGAAAGTDHLHDSLFTARFALNDISITAGIASAALLGMNAAAINAAATYEDAMAGIERTTSATAGQMALIQDQFVDLAQTIPGGFKNLAEIGTLAGQLNVPTERLASFTETVAQFVSTTDVGVQSAAESFGRLDALLPDVRGNYEALGSSILNVGVNSVATESAIISTTTQIAAAGAQARFTADEVVGLSASFASLGIAPEAARGSTIRIFSEIRQAALEGGEGLDTFAKLAGQSSDAFASAWLEGDSSEAFLSFLRGLQAEGANAETTLRDLGITGVRDINALLRLSQNVDVVTDSFGYANDGFSEASQLATAFGITSETLNSKVAILGQSFEAFLATLGESGSGPLKVFIDALSGLLRWMTDMAKSPAFQMITFFTGLFAVLSAGVLILTAVAARFGALTVAAITTRESLARMTAQAAMGDIVLSKMGASALRAATWITSMSNVMKVAFVTGGITAGIALIVGGIAAIAENSKTAGQRAKDAWGDLATLTSALQKDTEELGGDMSKALGTVEGKMTTTREKTDGWVVSLEEATGASTGLATETDRTTKSVRDFTYAIGENTAAFLANKLASTPAVAELFKSMEKAAAFELPTPNIDGFLTAAVRNDTETAKAILDKYRLQVEYIRATDATRSGLSDAENVVAKMEETLTLTTGALQEASTAGKVNTIVNEALGTSATIAGEEIDGMGDAAETTASKLSELKAAIEAAFGFENAVGAMATDVQALFQGLVDAGTGFDAFSEAGINNLDNLQGAIATTIIAGEQMGLSAAQSVAALFLELERRGVDTANLLANLANIPAIGPGGLGEIQKIMSGDRGLPKNAESLNKAFRGLTTTAPEAAKAIGGGRGVGGAAKKAAEEVRTLLDYSSDLEKVWKRAFDIRFSSQGALDQIQSSWIGIREAITDANKAIAEAQRRINELTTDNNSLAYFQQVAIDYGDSLRAAEIADEIAKNQADMAEAGEDAAEANGTLNKSLTGTTKSAIKNREEITGLVSNYQDLLASYASSGMSQSQLAQKAAQLKAQFLQQATQLGYNSTQLQTYAKAFDDTTLAISKVPRNITVAMNINPALQALREFEAQAKKSAASVGNSIGSAVSGGSSKAKAAAWSAGNSFGIIFKQAMDAVLAKAKVRVQPIPGGTLRFDSKGNMVEGNVGNLRFFKTGGYTGGGGVNDAAGIVHGREYVVNAENTQRLGIPFLNALNSGMTPTAPSMPGVMVVELSSRDRALLAAAGNVNLSIDGRVIASASNSANFVSTQRGVN